MKNKSSNLIECLFSFISYKNAKLATFTKIHLSQKNGKNIQGNVIHKACLLSSVENKK